MTVHRLQDARTGFGDVREHRTMCPGMSHCFQIRIQVCHLSSELASYRGAEGLERHRHIDSARYYKNEAQVGEAVRRSEIPRQEVFVSTC